MRSDLAKFIPGLVHTPVTPFTADDRVDFDAYGRLIEFHLREGAQALALPMHAGESVSLSDAERQQLLEYALKKIGGRVPVIAHVSQSGTGLAAELARHAVRAGAAAIVATTPYYWTPPPAMLLEHFTQIGKAAGGTPFLVYNSPDEMAGVKISTDLVMKLIDRLGNFAGVVDASLDWQFMIEVISTAQRVRPEFQLLTGIEYMISAGAAGATSMFAPLASIAPRAVKSLWEICREEQYQKARPVQEALAALRQAVKPAGVAGLKGGMRLMDRECGEPRPPLDPFDGSGRERIAAGIRGVERLRAEPRGW